jgi:hypothetical protein
MTLNHLANSNLTIHKEPLHNQDSFVQAWKPQSLKSEATTFPAEMYTSPRIYQQEKARYSKLMKKLGIIFLTLT